MKRVLIVAGLVALVVVVLAGTALLKQNPIRYTEVRPEVQPLEPDMAAIPGGAFRMGNPDGTPEEQPVHEVELRPYSMGRFEVTNEEYRRFCDATGHPHPPDPWYFEGQNYFETRPRSPVIEISWSEAATYCKWLADRTGKPYHLPTEAQWEFAARGGLADKLYPWGDERRPGMAHMNTTEPVGPVTVGSYPQNGYGLHDVAGNVNEMTADWFDERYYRSSPRLEPQGPSGWSNYFTLLRPVGRSRLKGRCKVLRGGSYRAPWDWRTKNPDGRLETPAQVGAREYLYQAPYTHFDLGFRVAMGGGPGS